MKINKKRAALLGVIAIECGLIGGLIGYNLNHEKAKAAEVTEVTKIHESNKSNTSSNTFDTSGNTYTNYKSLGEFVISHYCSCETCCNKSDGITASGTQATAGRTIAADPDVLPMGSTVIIDGHTYTVEDVGGAIKGNRIDIFMDSHEEALQAGVKTVEVFEEV